MEEVPGRFLIVLLAVLGLAVVLTFVIVFWKNYKLKRLQDPHKDHYRKRR